MYRNREGEQVRTRTRVDREAVEIGDRTTHVRPWRSVVPSPRSKSELPARERNEAHRFDRAHRFITRLRERKLVQWLLGYVAFAWVIVQGIEALGEIWAWSTTLQRTVTLLLGLGVFPTAVVAWYHGEKGRQKICVLEMLLMAGLTAGSVVAIRSLCL